jgi:Ca2+-binding EF-hand superfamily protein
MLDKDGDGVVTEQDLRAMLHSLGTWIKPLSDLLGQDTSSSSLRKMLSMVPTPIEFPAFMTYITSLKSQISSRHELVGALTSFDENDSGYIEFEDIKCELVNTGPKRMTEDQVNVALQGFVEKTGKNKGKVLYAKFLDSMMGDHTVG